MLGHKICHGKCVTISEIKLFLIFFEPQKNLLLNVHGYRVTNAYMQLF
jgi:hypothetical protein